MSRVKMFLYDMWTHQYVGGRVRVYIGAERRRDQRGKRKVRARGLGNMIEVEVGEME